MRSVWKRSIGKAEDWTGSPGLGAPSILSETKTDDLTGDRIHPPPEDKVLEMIVKKAVSVCTRLTAEFNDFSDSSCSEVVSVAFDMASIGRVNVDMIAPAAFNKVREIFVVSDKMLIQSINQDLVGGVSKGKSGSFFFFTPDQKFVLKTLKASELLVLQQSLLKDYVDYVLKYPNTLLPRFYACFVISFKFITYRFFLSNNVFDTKLSIHEIYDLKGSLVGRSTLSSSTEKEAQGAALKDQEFRDRKRRLCFQKTLLLIFKLQLQSDILFLQDHGLMDYSLLVGIHSSSGEIKDSTSSSRSPSITFESVNESIRRLKKFRKERKKLKESELGRKLIQETPEGVSVFQRDVGGLKARKPEGAELNEIYFIGIIDIFQRYSIQKTLETAIQSLTHDKKQISSIDVVEYAARFLEFIESIVQ